MNPKLWYKIKRFIPNYFYDDFIYIYYKSISMLYLGNNVICPCCGGKHSKFRELGEYGVCPSCGSGARHRNMYYFLKHYKHILNSNGIKILHFAPEYCSKTFFKNIDPCNYISADINSPRAKEKIDMTNINYKDNSFDVVISMHVLEHINKDCKALQEVYRVVKPGGYAINQVPIDYNRKVTFEDSIINTNDLRQKFYGHIDHKRIYGKDFKNRLESVGFKVIEIDYIKSLPDDIVNTHGLNRKEIIYYCEKY